MNDEQYVYAVNTYADTLFKMAYSVCKNKQDAEDAVQNAYLRLYTSKKLFDNNEHLKNWLIKVTINSCKHSFTTPWKSKTILLEEYKDKDNGSYTIDQDLLKQEVLNAVMTLPVKYRIAVHLYYYEDYSVKEIANITGDSETAVQTRLMRARKNLKEKLKEVWQNEE